MSDKSFGDHTNRNIVKNPLLSTAVTGLSLEDLTHKAVLLPVTPSLDQITRSDQQQGSQGRTLAQPKHETSIFPSGDAFSNITLSSSPQITNENLLDSKKILNLEEIHNAQNVTQSKASAKSDDDFDVNEYIARLQGSRYVSAPLHSHLKDDQNANLEATEENLEEINLNETIPVETQQSLTADIAQNFSQLPTVLPHVASAVFSSFSNMLSYKSREQTPDHPRGADHGNKSGYDEVQFQRPDVGIPLMGVEEYKAAKEVAPPPKEPPIGGTSNFRIATKKKYAQIPGLSSGDAAQPMTYPPAENVPSVGQNMPPKSQNIPLIGPNVSLSQNIPPVGQNAPYQSSFAQHLPNIGHNLPSLGQTETLFVQSVPPVDQHALYLDPNNVETPKTVAEEIKIQESNLQTQSVAEKPSVYNIFNPPTENITENKPVQFASSNESNLLADSQNVFTPVEHKKQNIPPNPGNAPIIPPPPMFSNLPRRDSQSSIGKSVLPPSVARRISANQPIIKPAVSAPSFTENIFVPPMPDATGSGQADNNFSSGASSAFVSAYNTPLKSEPIGSGSNIPPPSQINVPSSIPPIVDSTYLIPSNEAKPPVSVGASVFFSPKETATLTDTSLPSSSISMMAPSAPPVIPSSAFSLDTSFGPTASNLPASNVASINMPPPSSIFTPGNIDIKPQNVPPPALQSPPQNVPPTFFNPLQVDSLSSNAPHPITQMPSRAAFEPPKAVAEPPKATGNLNFRMTKKRPQYYAGPIEGIGSISNNFKPILTPVTLSATPVETSHYQGALFTPEQPMQPAIDQYASSNIEQTTVPFDIIKPVQPTSPYAGLNISKPQEQICGTDFNMRQPESQNYEQEYNTPFDMSRDQSTPYNQQKQESIGFGIIGSLKSKLSSIDINKIQSTVTTFFDPTYNETKVPEPIGQNNAPYQQQKQFGQTSQGQSNFDLFVPSVDQYNQFTHGFDYSHSSQYHQIQGPYSQNQGQSQNVSSYSTCNYFTDPNYSTEQVYSSNPCFDPQGNIPQKVETLNAETSKTDNTLFYDANAFTHKSITKSPVQHSGFDTTFKNKDDGNAIITPEIIQQNTKYFDPDMKHNVENITLSHSQQNVNKQKKSPVVSSEEDSNMTFCNPNAFAQENRQIWEPQQSYDNFASFSQPPLGQQLENTVSTSALEKHEPIFYNPTVFTIDHKDIPVSQKQQLFESNIQCGTVQEEFKSTIHKPTSGIPIAFRPTCDSALNTSKYNMAGIESHAVQQSVTTNVPLLPAASFFDNPVSTHFPLYSKDDEIDIKSAGVLPPIGTKSQGDFTKSGKDNKDLKFEKEQQVKEGNLIESLSKDDIPVLGVSTVPLFGLSTIISDKSKEVSGSEKLFLFDSSHHSKSIFDSKTAASFFENKEPENRIISEDQVKKTSLDITALSIHDVKNVLVIEPPQEDIVALLKRNASSSKVENRPENPPQHFKQQSKDFATNQGELNMKFDENITETFFKHPDDIVKEIVDNDLQKVTSVDEEHSELNICETCREVSTPEHERNHTRSEDLTSQLIENITSRMELSNPLTVPLKESDVPVDERYPYDNSQQLDEITKVAEETYETLEAQSATELLDKRNISEVRDYGWTTEEDVYPVASHVDHDYTSNVVPGAKATKRDCAPKLDDVSALNLEQNYEFKLDPNAIGLFDDNSLFFDNVPTNASDEIKAEIKHSHADIVLPRQMSVPTAPPEEADENQKLDEPGVLDVHSIEQDAKNDFPIEEEFIIEPSTDDFLSTDDDKIEFTERKRSSEDSTSNDTFTNRIERFKKIVDNPNESAVEEKSYGSPPIPMASYFDTGNYAVESHYRNSLVTMRIPPGFEEEYARKLSGISLRSADSTAEPYIPETSTQTRPINTPTYSSPHDAKENIIGSEILEKENTASLAQAFVGPKSEASTTQSDKPTVIADQTQMASVFPATTTQSKVFSQKNVEPLSDPINFFSANVEEPKSAEPAASENFSRLASYFSMPPAQPEHSKSFFELSQSQNHYRHEIDKQENKPQDNKIQKSFFELSQSQNHYIDDDTKNNIKELMKDLTSPQNIKEQTVKTVNYFTVEHNNDIKHNNNAAPINIKINDININKPIDTNILPNNEVKLVENDSKNKYNDCDDIINCEYCCRYIPGVNTKVFIVKTAVNEPSEPSKKADMSYTKDNTTAKPGNAVNFADFDVEKQGEDSVTVTNEHRAASDYTPVKHHWFYRVDVEDKSVWRGFSNTDSTALEEAYHSPELNENTLVATDGGRYDVNVVGRLRIAVYWKEKPTNVRRCSWFYKGTTDARYVPYTESVAEKLEEEYRHGVSTGEWHRKMVLPNSEMVIMHGPSVMVHFLHSGATDAFSTPPNLLGKRVYRSPPKIRVERDQESKIDHLILLVHGAGEYKRTRYLDQAASRPRVVRRSHDESEIEESEPSRIDHLLLLCHGVGSACDMRFRSVEEVVEDFRTTSLQLLQSHYRNSYDNGLVSRVEVLPISWHEQLHAGETGVDKRLARVTLDSIPRLRAFTNHTVLDVLFYTSPVFHQSIIDTVCFELNRVYTMFRDRNPHFDGAVSLGGHSLGSVILYDLLRHQSPESPLEVSECRRHVTGAAGTGQPVDYPQLVFPPAALYALGSPIAIFECIRGAESLGMEFALPTCKNFFNIFHPYDPIAYRIEPLINPQLQEVKPSQIPHHKGRKRMHLELKDTMARVGADLKQKLIESLRTTWNKWKSTPPTDGQLEKVVEEEMEKEQLTNGEEPATEVHATADMLGRLNAGRRVDYVLQEAPLEMINEYLFAMSSHVGYWESEDTMLLMLREIYDSLGVQPDCTVPQHTMTLHRNNNTTDEGGKSSNEPGSPSTSRGST